MYALAFYPEDGEPLHVLDRKLRDWLGQNAEPGSWDTCWAGSSNVGYIIRDHWHNAVAVTAMIESAEDAAMIKLWFDGATEDIAHYYHVMMLNDLNIKVSGYTLTNHILHSRSWRTMWTDGLFLYYTSDDDLIYLKLRFA